MDRFHRRLLWPIRTSAGVVIGFGGRRLFEDGDACKFTAIKRALAAKRWVRLIAMDLKTGVGTVLRIKNELAA
jgi:DNA primase